MNVKTINNKLNSILYYFLLILLFIYFTKLNAQSINKCMKEAVEKGIKYNKILTICRENISLNEVYSNSYNSQKKQNNNSTYLSTNKTDKIIHEMIKGGDLAKAGMLATRLESEKTKRIKARAEAEALRSPQIIATTSSSNENSTDEIRSTIALGNNPIKSVNAGSKILEITTPGIHGAIPGQFVTISNVDSSIDGIAANEINKKHIISSVPTTSTLTISVLSNAINGSISGGGANILAIFQK